MEINEAIQTTTSKSDQATPLYCVQDHLELRDPLTGLPNRDLFIDRMSRELARERRYERGFALMMINLEKFGSVDAENGLAVGDSLLRDVAKLLQSNVRDIDTVARVGGDEFAILLNGISNKKEAELVARKIINSMSEPIRLENGIHLKVGARVGIALSPQDGNQTEQLMLCADQALSAIKNSRIDSIGYSVSSRNPESVLTTDSPGDMRLGISIIDAQHTSMANFIQGILDSLAHGDKSIKLEKRVELLIELCQIHFQTEEDLMRQHDLPGLEEHHAEHQRRLMSLRTIFRKLNFSEQNLENVAQEINEWLLGHIRGQDTELSTELKNKGVS